MSAECIGEMRYLKRDRGMGSRRIEDLIAVLQRAVRERWDVDEVIEGVLSWMERWEDYFDTERMRQRIFGVRMREGRKFGIGR